MNYQQAQAMIFDQVQQPFVPRPIPLPELGQGEVLVEMRYATICSSDLHSFYGRRSTPMPTILGHENMGAIVGIGPGGVADYYGEPLAIGDSVSWMIYAHDHAGEMARKGIPQKSAGLFKYGHEKLDDHHPLSGGFATHCHLKSGTDIFKLPANLLPKEAAPLNCAHATMAGAIRLAGDLLGKNVLVIGAGMLGLSACAMAKEAGARQVWAMDIEPDRLTRALEFGVSKTVPADLSVEASKILLDQAGGVDVVLESSGAPAAMEKGLALLNIGGISVWIGAVYPQRDLAVNAEKVIRNILTIKGLHNYIPEDLAYAIRFMAAHHQRYPFAELVRQEFGLQELDLAFAAAGEKGEYRVGVRFF